MDLAIEHEVELDLHLACDLLIADYNELLTFD